MKKIALLIILMSYLSTPAFAQKLVSDKILRPPEEISGMVDKKINFFARGSGMEWSFKIVGTGKHKHFAGEVVFIYVNTGVRYLNEPVEYIMYYKEAGTEGWEIRYGKNKQIQDSIEVFSID